MKYIFRWVSHHFCQAAGIFVSETEGNQLAGRPVHGSENITN
jgi:hypothetical protein